jgi:hypothetical protein
VEWALPGAAGPPIPRTPLAAVTALTPAICDKVIAVIGGTVPTVSGFLFRYISQLTVVVLDTLAVEIRKYLARTGNAYMPVVESMLLA